MNWCGEMMNSWAFEESGLARKLSAGAGGIFILWIGLVLLIQIESGIALLGIGAITLGSQAMRRWLGLSLEGFWIVVGALFSLGGIWLIADTGLPLFPVVLILAGGATLISVFFHWHGSKTWSVIKKEEGKK